MNEKIRKSITKDKIPYIILLIAFIFIHIKMNTNYGDDIALRNTSEGVLEHFFKYYHSWGSPSLISFFSIYLTRLPDIYFKICDVLIILLIQYSISKITDDKNLKYTKLMITLFIILYPFNQMATAGWIATSTIYIFTLSFGLYAFIYLRLVIDNKEISRLNYVFLWISLVLGCGGVQLSFIILGIYSTFNFFFAIKRKVYKFSILQNITALLFTVYHLTAPGNAIRSVQETITWFPDFNMISTLNKTKLGFTSTLGDLISTSNVFFLCFSFLLVIGVYCKYKNDLYRLIALIPFISVLLFGIFRNIFSNVFPNLVSLMNNGSADFLQINLYDFHSKSNYLSIILGFAIVGAMVTSVYLIFENTLKMIVVEIIFLAGFCSRMIMSFSPTIYASSTRTFIYLYFAMVVCGTLVFNNISENITEEKQKKILMYISIIAIINYLQLLIII